MSSLIPMAVNSGFVILLVQYQEVGGCALARGLLKKLGA